MATDKVYDDLVLNVLTEEQYKNLAEKDPDQIYLTETKGIQQYEEMPEATAEDVGKIVQYVGETNEDYTNGYFYKCVSNGSETPAYKWEMVDVQKSDLPGQTGHTGFLQTDGTNISWSDKKAVENTWVKTSYNQKGLCIESSGTSANYCIAIGGGGASNDSVTIGYSTYNGYNGSIRSIAIGYGAKIMASAPDAIQLGNGSYSVELPEFHVWDYNLLNKTTGLIPTERLASDGTTGQVLSKTDTGMAWETVDVPTITIREW